MALLPPQQKQIQRSNGRRNISVSRSIRQVARLQELDTRYFWANDLWSSKTETRRNWSAGAVRRTQQQQQQQEKEKDGGIAGAVKAADAYTPATSAATEAVTTIDSHPSPRPRARRKGTATPDTTTLPDLPLDASAQLSALASAAPTQSLKRTLATYLSLTKPRLAFLVVLTTTASYSLYPVPSLLSVAATHTPSLSSLTLLFLTTGTFGTIAAANTLNMLFEPAYDAQMSRTRNRPLVRGLISKRSAFLFAIGSAVTGTGILWYGVNPTTALLGFGNMCLYAFVYTPLKRRSVINTWVGAVVGAIPPLMGWCAAGGSYITSTSSSPTSSSLSIADEASALLFSDQAIGGWLLAFLLFSWQFPHFNALSHPIRHEYKNAGYKMLVSANPARNTRVALRYSLAMFPICIGLSYIGVTDPYFVLTSSVINGWMAKEAWKFWRSGGGEEKVAAKTARGLFWASVWHLPIVLVLAMAQKKGLWEGLWRGIVGAGMEEEEWEWEDEEE